MGGAAFLGDARNGGGLSSHHRIFQRDDRVAHQGGAGGSKNARTLRVRHEKFLLDVLTDVGARPVDGELRSNRHRDHLRRVGKNLCRSHCLPRVCQTQHIGDQHHLSRMRGKGNRLRRDLCAMAVKQNYLGRNREIQFTYHAQ
jgi:hypothetical protein